jgi:hypothetical protein
MFIIVVALVLLPELVGWMSIAKSTNVAGGLRCACPPCMFHVPVVFEAALIVVVGSVLFPEYWVRAGVSALVLLLLSGCGASGDDPTAATPELVYEDGFLSPPEDAIIEAAGGTVVLGYEAWLKLLPERDIVPRHENAYVFRDCAEPRAYFKHVLGSDELSSATASLTCREYSDPRFDFDNGRWLLVNETDGRIYFRVWKHHADGFRQDAAWGSDATMTGAR